jgi:hypothetical protein
MSGPRGSRPRVPHDQRYTSAYPFGAVCPARGVGAALVLPGVNIAAMNLHLAEISSQVALGAHAVITLDGAAGIDRAAASSSPTTSACCPCRRMRRS